MPKIEIGNLPIDKIYFGNLPIDKIFYGNVEVYSALQQLDAPIISLSEDILSIEEVENAEYYDIYVDGVLEESMIDVVYPPQISLINDNADLQITSTNEGEEKYEIYVNGSSIGTFNQGYTFLHDGEIITKCLGVENYTGIITVPAEIDNMPITTLSKLAASVTLFDNCKASKIIISEGITTINSNIFTPTSETVNVVIPSTISKTSNILSNYPHDLIVGREGYIEYGWNTTIPAEGFAFGKTLTMATTFIFDIKSTITNIGNNAFKFTSMGNYAATFNMYFRQPNNVTVTFGTTIIGTGSQKSARTYNIYTDNEGVKTTFEGYAAQYTTINVYKLDGSAWE